MFQRVVYEYIAVPGQYTHILLGCVILPKVIGFIDSPLNPIIWTTNSPPSEKILKNFHKQGPALGRLGYVYAVLSKALLLNVGTRGGHQ